MASLCYNVASCSGLIRTTQAKLPFHNRQNVVCKFNNFNGIKVAASTRILRGHVHRSSASGFGTTFALRTGGDRYQPKFDDDLPEEPFFLSLIKEVVWGVRSLVIFLVEQPSQLKYIEWPGFPTTLKTATLTLALVAMLIVALSSIDSVLSFLLALLLRKTP